MNVKAKQRVVACSWLNMFYNTGLTPSDDEIVPQLHAAHVQRELDLEEEIETWNKKKKKKTITDAVKMQNAKFWSSAVRRERSAKIVTKLTKVVNKYLHTWYHCSPRVCISLDKCKGLRK
jgi:hypothetical protein